MKTNQKNKQESFSNAQMRQANEELDEAFNKFREQPIEFEKTEPVRLVDLSLSDLISLHGWIDYEADLIEALGGDNTVRLEKAREHMVLVHQEIERRRSLIFGTESED